MKINGNLYYLKSLLINEEMFFFKDRRKHSFANTGFWLIYMYSNNAFTHGHLIILKWKILSFEFPCKNQQHLYMANLLI